MGKNLKIFLLLGAIAILLSAVAFAAPPSAWQTVDGEGFGSWTVTNGTVYDDCATGSLGCSAALAEKGIFQREVRDSQGYYYYQTIIVTDTATGDPRDANTYPESDPGVRFWTESFTRVQYGEDESLNWNAAAIYQFIDYDGYQRKDDRMTGTTMTTSDPNLMRDSNYTPLEYFDSTFEVVTGDLYVEQFGTPISGGHKTAVSISQTIRGYDAKMAMMTNTRGELLFNSTFGREEDHGHDKGTLSVAQDIFIGAMGETPVLSSLNDPNRNDEQRFRVYKVENPDGEGTIGFDTDLDGTDDVFLQWKEKSDVEFVWFGQNQRSAISGFAGGLGEWGYYSYEVENAYDLNSPYNEGYSVLNYMNSSGWYTYPPNANDPSYGDDPFATENMADPNNMMGWNNFTPSFAMDWGP